MVEFPVKKKNGRPNGSGPAKRYLQDVVLNHVGTECLIWPFRRDANGYGQVGYDGRIRTASRIVCEIINGSPPTSNHQAAHSCGNGHLGCVSPLHVSWKTKSENENDKNKHGTSLIGSRNVNAILSDADVVQIRMLKDWLSQREIAVMFGVSRSTVGDIITGKNWGWLKEESAAFNSPETAKQTVGGFPVAAAPTNAEETGVIHSTREWNGMERGMDHSVTDRRDDHLNSTRPATPAGSGGDRSIPSSDDGGAKMDERCTAHPGRDDYASCIRYTEFEQATNNQPRSSIRPLCRNPNACGGYGRNHCHACKTAAADLEAAE